MSSTPSLPPGGYAEQATTDEAFLKEIGLRDFLEQGVVRLLEVYPRPSSLSEAVRVLSALQVELEQARTVCAGGENVAASDNGRQLPTLSLDDGENKVDAAGAVDGGQTGDIPAEMKVRRRYAHTHIHTHTLCLRSGVLTTLYLVPSSPPPLLPSLPRDRPSRRN